MADYIAILDQASKSLSAADHIVYVTYTLVSDPKLLLAAIENLYKAFENTVSSLLIYEQEYKRISSTGESIDAKLYTYNTKVATRYNFSRKYFVAFSEIREILDWHKKSPVEFRRREKYIICMSDYRMKTLTMQKIKDYVDIAKSFITDVEKIVKKNERVRRRFA
ncbi:MAG TPA: hypothetical protein ENN46_04000 [Candidatus Woesearchaeota archaeon]|nr:hypothetical protein [Candidatus Woesearchaeota archaeon]